MQRHPHPRAFVLVEALVLVVLLAVLAAMAAAVLPMFGGSGCRINRPMQNSTQLRGIHQGMVMYAQGNRSYFPGLNKDGGDAGTSVENRFLIMLRQNYFTGEYAISPAESKPAWTTGNLTTAQYSYALLQLPDHGNRRAEWAQTLNTNAIVVSDRNIAQPGSPAASVWSGQSHGTSGWGCSSSRHPKTWVGSVLWNDNHVGFESTTILRTTYGPALAQHQSHPWFDASAATPTVNNQDDLFTASSTSDAMMVHSGN